MLPKLDIIIVNRNSGNLLKKCLTSISLTDQDNYLLSSVVVVDDLSVDDSLVGVENVKLPLKIIHNEKRSGYGVSCNIGSEYCKSDYLLFLNTDVILNNNSLVMPIQFLEEYENKQIAILGIKQLDKKGNIQKHCSRFPTVSMLFYKTLGLNKIFPSFFQGPMMIEWDHLETRQVDQVIGAVMFMRREIFEKIGGYDERFFVYYEDTDLSLRTRDIGFKSIYLDSVSVYHIGGSTARKTWSESLFFNLRSRFIYAFKHFNFISAIIVTFISLILEPVVRVLRSVFILSIKDVILNIKVALLLWLNLPFVIIKKPRINWPLK